jgi:RHS repeat-associated protein
MARSSLAVRLHSARAIVAGAATVAVTLLWPSALFGQTWQVVEYYDTDALGSIRIVTDARGQAVARHDFLPFGEELSPQIPPHDKKLFTGQERDFETGQDYFAARQLRADLGRFTTVDPELRIQEALLDPQKWNRYAYVSNNPLRYVDPNGRWGIDVHFYLTYFLAGASGYSSDRAYTIASADLNVDIEHNPFRSTAERRKWHFPDAMRTVEVMEVMANEPDDATFGGALHVYQDSSSHFGYAAWKGHLAESIFGAHPDRTSENIDNAMAMAHDSYNFMVKRSDREREAIPWSKVAPYVRRYLEAGSAKEKERRFYEMRQFLLGDQQ